MKLLIARARRAAWDRLQLAPPQEEPGTAVLPEEAEWEYMIGRWRGSDEPHRHGSGDRLSPALQEETCGCSRLRIDALTSQSLPS
jgi:hypothetical protein